MNTNSIVYVGNTAKTMQAGDCFQTLRLCRRSRGLKNPLLEGTLCIFGSHTFVSNQLDVQENKTVRFRTVRQNLKSSLWDTRLRLDGLPALELCDLIVLVFGSVSQIFRWKQGDLLMLMLRDIKKSPWKINVMENIDSVPSKRPVPSRQEALLYVFEDNEAVIKMIIKGKESPQ